MTSTRKEVPHMDRPAKERIWPVMQCATHWPIYHKCVPSARKTDLGKTIRFSVTSPFTSLVQYTLQQR